MSKTKSCDAFVYVENNNVTMLRNPYMTKFKAVLEGEQQLDPSICLNCRDNDEKGDPMAFVRRFPKIMHSRDEYPSFNEAKKLMKSASKEQKEGGGGQPDFEILGRSIKINGEHKHGGYLFDYETMRFGCKTGEKGTQCIAEKGAVNDNSWFRNNLVNRGGNILYCGEGGLKDKNHWCSKILEEFKQRRANGLILDENLYNYANKSRPSNPTPAREYAYLGYGYCKDEYNKRAAESIAECGLFCDRDPDCNGFAYTDKEKQCLMSKTACKDRIQNKYEWKGFAVKRKGVCPTVVTPPNIIDTLLLTYSVHNEETCTKKVSSGKAQYNATIAKRFRKSENAKTFEECKKLLKNTSVNAIEFTQDKKCFSARDQNVLFRPSLESQVVTKFTGGGKSWNESSIIKSLEKKRILLPWEIENETDCQKCGHVVDSTGSCKFDLARYKPDEFEMAAVLSIMNKTKLKSCVLNHIFDLELKDGINKSFKSERVLESLLPSRGKRTTFTSYSSHFIKSSSVYDKFYTSSEALEPYKKFRIVRGGLAPTKSSQMVSRQTVKNLGKGCWNECREKQGRCNYCGSGYCCRSGRKGGGCDGSMGFHHRHHMCVPAPYKTPPGFNSSFRTESLQGDRGKDYRGSTNVTYKGHTCQSWNKGKHTKYRRLGSHNHCRNPDGEPSIWCYTTNGPKWDYCTPKSYTATPVSRSLNIEALLGEKGAGYRGNQNRTVSGRMCMAWNKQNPHEHGNFGKNGAGNHNYCRNPDGEKTIWCYTTDPKKRWEYCKPLAATRKAAPKDSPEEHDLEDVFYYRPNRVNNDVGIVKTGGVHHENYAVGFDGAGIHVGRVLKSKPSLPSIPIKRRYHGKDSLIGRPNMVLGRHNFKMEGGDTYGYAYRDPQPFTVPLYVAYDFRKKNTSAGLGHMKNHGGKRFDSGPGGRGNQLIGHIVSKNYKGPAHSGQNRFRYCAMEGQTCYLPDGMSAEVSYGFHKWRTRKWKKGSFKCDNSTFGDPSRNNLKTCFVKVSGQNKNYVKDLVSLQTQEEKDRACLINNPTYGMAKWIPESCGKGVGEEILTMGGKEKRNDGRPTSHNDRSWSGCGKARGHRTSSKCSACGGGYSCRNDNGSYNKGCAPSGGDTRHHRCRAAPPGERSVFDDWQTTCTAGAKSGMVGSCRVRAQLFGNSGKVVVNHVLRTVQMKRLDMAVEREKARLKVPKKLVTLETAATCQRQCDKDARCKAFSVDAMGIMCELYGKRITAPAVETAATRIVYNKGEKSDSNARYIPRAKCSLRKGDVDFTELVVNHKGVRYRALCPLNAGKRAVLINKADNSTLLSKPTVKTPGAYENRDSVCGLPIGEGGFATKELERGTTSLAQAGPNFAVCPIAQSEANRKTRDNVFELPNGDLLHVNCRAHNSAPPKHISHGDLERGQRYKHFERSALPGFNKDYSALIDSEDAFAGDALYEWSKGRELSGSEYRSIGRSAARKAAIAGLRGALETEGSKQRPSVETSDMCTRPREHSTDVYTGSVGSAYKLFPSKLHREHQLTKSTIDLGTSEGYYDDSLRERMCMCNKSFYKMGWDSASRDKTVDYALGQKRLDSAEKRIEFVHDVRECWAPQREKVDSASGVNIWEPFVKRGVMEESSKARTKVQSRQKVAARAKDTKFFENLFLTKKDEMYCPHKGGVLAKKMKGKSCFNIGGGNSPSSLTYFAAHTASWNVNNLDKTSKIAAYEFNQFSRGSYDSSHNRPKVKGGWEQKRRNGELDPGTHSSYKGEMTRRIVNAKEAGVIPLSSMKKSLVFYGKKTDPKSNLFGWDKSYSSYKNNVFVPWRNETGAEDRPHGRSRADMFLDTMSGFMSSEHYKKDWRYRYKRCTNYGVTCRGGRSGTSTSRDILGSYVDTNHTDRLVMDRSDLARPRDPFTGNVLFDPTKFEASKIETDYCAFVPASKVHYNEHRGKQVGSQCLRPESLLSPLSLLKEQPKPEYVWSSRCGKKGQTKRCAPFAAWKGMLPPSLKNSVKAPLSMAAAKRLCDKTADCAAIVSNGAKWWPVSKPSTGFDPKCTGFKKPDTRCWPNMYVIDKSMPAEPSYMRGPSDGRVQNPMSGMVSVVGSREEAERICNSRADCSGFSLSPECPLVVFSNAPNDPKAPKKECEVAFMETLAQMNQLDKKPIHNVFLKSGIKGTVAQMKTLCDNHKRCGGFTFNSEKEEAVAFFKLNFPRPKGVTDGERGPLETCLSNRENHSYFEVDHEDTSHPKLFTDPLCVKKLAEAQKSAANFSKFMSNKLKLGDRIMDHCFAYNRTPNVPGNWRRKDEETKKALRTRCTSLAKSGCDEAPACQWHPALTEQNPSKESFCDIRRNMNYSDSSIEGNTTENKCDAFIRNDPTTVGTNKGALTKGLINKFQEKNPHMRESKCSYSSAKDSTSKKDFTTDAGDFACTLRACVKDGEALVTREIKDYCATKPIQICQQTISVNNVTIVGEGNELNLTQGCTQQLGKLDPGSKCGAPWDEYQERLKARTENGQDEDIDDRANTIQQCIEKITREYKQQNNVPEKCKLAINVPSDSIDKAQAKKAAKSCKSAGDWEACVLPGQEGCPVRLTADFQTKCESVLGRVSSMIAEITEQAPTTCSADPANQCSNDLKCRVQGTKLPCIDAPPATTKANKAKVGDIEYACYPGINYPIGLDSDGKGVCLSADGAKCGRVGDDCQSMLEQAKVTAPKTITCVAAATTDLNTMQTNYGTTRGWCAQLMSKTEKGRDKLPTGVRDYFMSDKVPNSCECNTFFDVAFAVKGTKNKQAEFCKILGREALNPMQTVGKLETAIDAFQTKTGVQKASCLNLQVNRKNKQTKELEFLFDLTGNPGCVVGQNQKLEKTLGTLGNSSKNERLGPGDSAASSTLGASGASGTSGTSGFFTPQNIGIIVGSVLGLALLAGVAYFLLRKKPVAATATKATAVASVAAKPPKPQKPKANAVNVAAII